MTWEGEAPQENINNGWEGEAPGQPQATPQYNFKDTTQTFENNYQDNANRFRDVVITGLNKGASGVLGMPVDIINSALNVAGIGTQKPVMGSQWIQDLTLPQPTKATGAGENILQSAAELLPGFIAPVPGMQSGLFAAIKNMIPSAVGTGLTREYVPNNPLAELAGAFIPGGIRTGANLLSKTSLPESIYARTMKMPPGSLSDPERAKVLNTLVREEQLPLGSKTISKINNTVGELETNITTAIDKATGYGEQVSVSNILNNLDTLKFTYANRPDPDKYYRAIDAVKRDMIEHDFNNRIKKTRTVQTQSSILDQSGNPFALDKEITEFVPTGYINTNKAHDLKKGIYNEIQSYYMKQQKPETGRIGIRNDVDAAAKANVARTIRKEILDSVEIPQSIKLQMKREAGLMNARKWVERATNRGGNLDPVSLSGMMFGVLVEKGLPATAAWRIATSQPVMSRIAIKLGKTRNTGFSNLLPFATSTIEGMENQPNE